VKWILNQSTDDEGPNSAAAFILETPKLNYFSIHNCTASRIPMNDDEGTFFVSEHFNDIIYPFIRLLRFLSSWHVYSITLWNESTFVAWWNWQRQLRAMLAVCEGKMFWNLDAVDVTKESATDEHSDAMSTHIHLTPPHTMTKKCALITSIGHQSLRPGARITFISLCVKLTSTNDMTK
jgi:hypothetical protein